mmetsp:Transcript_124/g.273  ORF Transcript_124/g.273 Transcript_124/m.273 type:complete len:244 (+) Transcript_124:21-752(+)
MTSVPAAGPAQTPERLSLQSVTLQRLERANRPLQQLNRLCLVGTLRESVSCDRVSDWFQSQARLHGDTADTTSIVTGMQLLLPPGFLVIMESSLPSLSAMMRALQAEISLGDGMLEIMKVVSCMDDVPSRCFNGWSFKTLDVAKSNYMEVDADTLPKLLSETMIGMLKLGKALSPMSKEEASTALSIWESNFGDFMPSNERVSQLLEIEEVPTLADFIAVYETPSELTLMPDMVWPPDRPLVY